MNIAVLAILGSLLFGGSALAQPVVPLQPFMKPVIEPGIPVAGEPITVYVRTYACVAFTLPAHFVLAQNGNDIDLIIDGFANVGDGCNLPDVTTAWPIGALPAGSYRLRILINDELSPSEPIVIDTAVTDFVVVAAAHPVPVGHATNWLLLAAAIGLIAAGAITRRCY